MKCYAAGCHDSQWDYSDVCFAENWKQARKLLWASGHNIQAECDGEYLAMFVRRKPEFDKFLAEGSPYVVRDAKTLRAMGFGYEDDDHCDSCTLASFLGKFPVCPDCEYCNECGCECERLAS